MYTTHALLSSCRSAELSNLNYTDLVVLYRKAKDDKKEQSRIFATIFCKLFKMLDTIAKKFETLKMEQKVETCMFTILKCLDRFDTSKKASFSTLVYTAYRNALLDCVYSAGLLKNQVWENGVDWSSEKLDFYFENLADRSVNSQHQVEFYIDHNIKRNQNLSAEQKLYCELVLRGFTKRKDLVQQMDLNNRQLFSLKKNKYTNKKYSEGYLDDYVKNIQKGLREEIKKNRDFI